MAKSAMPVSKAKTAYGLLSEIRKLIIEEPKRYDQESVLRRRVVGEYAPACGTVGCVAGWVVALKAPRVRDGGTLKAAARILGLPFKDYQITIADHLFNGDAAGWRGEDFAGHAERGAEHIARFQKQYAAQLKAKKV